MSSSKHEQQEKMPVSKYGQRYAGRVAVVTASSTGIGMAIAERFAAEGGSVVISSRKQANIDKAIDLICSRNPSARDHLLGR
jgi:dehydrogenase/reductase SDR family member 4